VRWMFGFMRACAEIMEVRVRGGAVAGLAILRGRRTGGVRDGMRGRKRLFVYKFMEVGEWERELKIYTRSCTRA
jgi:hypothetical protein